MFGDGRHRLRTLLLCALAAAASIGALGLAYDGAEGLSQDELDAKCAGILPARYYQLLFDAIDDRSLQPIVVTDVASVGYVIRGTPDADLIVVDDPDAGHGAWIDGGGGDDVICGTPWDDFVVGGGGNDYIVGGNTTDRDWIYGENGNDTVFGAVGPTGVGKDMLYGGAGDDLLISEYHLYNQYSVLGNFTTGGAPSFAPTGTGTSSYGGEGYDVLLGGGGDTLQGEGWSDKIYATARSGLNLFVSGGDGNDLIELTEDVAGASELHGGAGVDTINGGAGADWIKGHEGNDIMRGRGGDDRIEGWDGNDNLYGGDGDDQLNGGGGDDPIRGGNGNDTLTGGPGVDDLRGEEGNDHFYLKDGVKDVADGGGGAQDWARSYDGEPDALLDQVAGIEWGW